MTKSEADLNNILSMIPNQINIKIHGCSRRTVLAGWKKGLQINMDQHILFVKSGKGIYYFDGKEETLERGKIIFVSSNCPHSVWHDTENPPVITGLRFGFYDNKTGQMIDIPCSPFYISINTDDIEFFDKLCENINQLYYSINYHVSMLQCSSAITYLLSEILYRKMIHQKNTNINNGRIERVQRFIMNDIDSNIPIEEYAKTQNMSSRYLRYSFKKIYGVTPKQYQLKTRMNYAEFLLKTTDLPIKKIAVSVGYSDQFVFSRQFRIFYGYAPSEVRKKLIP